MVKQRFFHVAAEQMHQLKPKVGTMRFTTGVFNEVFLFLLLT